MNRNLSLVDELLRRGEGTAIWVRITGDREKFIFHDDGDRAALISELQGATSAHLCEIPPDVKEGIKAEREADKLENDKTYTLFGETVWLDAVRPQLRKEAVDCLAQGDHLGFLIKAYGNEHGVELVANNASLLRKIGVYEAALLDAFSNPRSNNFQNIDLLRELFLMADKEKLLKCGDSIPGAGMFTVYRGVAGSSVIRGLSWTGSLGCAWWFAFRYAKHLGSPAVYSATVGLDEVLAYLHSGFRSEDEYIVLLKDSTRVRRVQPKGAKAAARDWQRAAEKHNADLHAAWAAKHVQAKSE